jgi:biopolymer transport protein ExbB
MILLRLLPVSALVLAVSAIAAAAQEPTIPAATNIMRAALPRDLSAWSMFWSADSVVKAVMIGLALASVTTWTVGLAKAVELLMLKRRLLPALAILEGEGSLPEAQAAIGPRGPAAVLAAAALAEAALANDGFAEGAKERAGSRLERIEAAAGRTMTRGTGILATIGATAPFVGLFGTVWGIMRSFGAIAGANNSSLAVVAPGIAEALFATALGLFAAIPAVIAYNRMSFGINRIEARLARFADAFHATLSRELEREA